MGGGAVGEDLSAADMWGITARGNIFRAITSESEQQVPSPRLTAAIIFNCSLKTTLFALLGDKVIMHLCTS